MIVNCIAQHLITSLIIPALKNSTNPRIVFVSSVAHLLFPSPTHSLEWEHRQDLPIHAFKNEKLPDYDRPFLYYARSKLMILMDALEFAERYSDMHITVVHPGCLNTSLFR